MSLKIAVVMATLGRPSVVGEFLERLALQTRLPDAVVLSAETDADLPSNLPEGCQVVAGPPGASAQRNRGIERCCEDHDVILFLDDDFVSSRFYIAAMCEIFEQQPDILGLTGRVLADGVGSGGIEKAEAYRLIDEYDASPGFDHALESTYWTYGCNMAFRTTAIGDIRFDENLPLYSWQEDVDFSGRINAKGRLARSEAMVGVHRGVSIGRTSGVRFGYSQVVNPIYLVRKGTMPIGHAAKLMTRNLLANHLGVLMPSTHIDRPGRVRGNWIGLLDLVRGCANPRRVVDF